MNKELKTLQSVKSYKNFLNSDELNTALLHICTSKEIFLLGKSNQGKKILGAKIGIGKQSALVFGFPHPNEPIGSLTCLELIKQIKNSKVLQNRFTWYIIPCPDPDGSQLNGKWFKGKRTINKYLYNFYRPQINKQIDWTFPVKYKKYSFNKYHQGTRLLANLIKKTKPDLVCPLHSTDIGGAYFLLSEKIQNKKYYKDVFSLCNHLSIPLDLGEAEEELMIPIVKPVYKNYGLNYLYDYYTKEKVDPLKAINHGTDSINYAQKINPKCFGLIPEVPLFIDPRINNTKKVKVTRRTILKTKYKDWKSVIGYIDTIVKTKSINKSHIFYKLLKNFAAAETEYFAADTTELREKEYDAKATLAQKTTTEIMWRFHAAAYLGNCLHLLKSSPQTPTIKNLVKTTDEKIKNLISYFTQNAKISSPEIKKLVQAQLGFILISLKYLK